jgi:methionyl-tRNA formyltransferase
MLKYIFMGSPLFASTVLETLCEKLYPPVAVVTSISKATGRGQKIVPSEVEFFAKGEDLNVITSGDINNPATLSVLKVFEPDLILVAAFGQIFKEEILNLPKIACLNVHGSLLPAYRGAAPVHWAIWNGETKTGITIQKMVRKLDAGDILLSRETAIEADETSDSLMKRLAHLGGETLVDAVKSIEANQFLFTPQNETLATFAPKIEKKHAVVDWTQPAEKIHHQVRALQPWPIAETTLEGARMKIFKTRVETTENNDPPGTLYSDSFNYLSVRCGDGRALSLTEIQLENRKRLEIKEFLKAFRGSFPHRNVNSK